SFGTSLRVLNNGNVLVANPADDLVASQAGAVYLFDGRTGALISSLVGSFANDRVGNSGATVLSNGNYVVNTLSWNGNRGAVTWGSGTVGVNGTVSEVNSLVGSTSNDRVGAGVVALSNGNYVVRSTNWNGFRGAATWGNGTGGTTGAVSEANSL